MEAPLQTRNPAIDLYKFWLGIISHTSPGDIRSDPERASSHGGSLFDFRDGIGLHIDGFDHRQRPIIRLGWFFTIWPNGDFWCRHELRQYRWDNAERNLLHKYTFITHSEVVRSRVALIQDTPLVSGSIAHRGVRWYPDLRDLDRRRPYITCNHHSLFKTELLYKLVYVGNGDWKIRATKVVPDSRSWPTKKQRQLISAANADLDARYAVGERRYDRLARQREINEGRRLGLTTVPRQTQQQRTEILRAFVDRMIVFEPKSTPPGQDLLPFAREEAIAHG